MRNQRIKSVAVGVDEAKAFVSLMAEIDSFKNLSRNWRGPGTVPPGFKSLAAASRLVKDRQTMATRFTVEAGVQGDVLLHFVSEPSLGSLPGYVHINKDGRPAIVMEGSPEDAERYTGPGTKLFRKALDALISPRTGRYGIKRIEVDGIMFDSTDEGKRYRILKSEEALGKIRDLRMQVPYPYAENGKHCFTYKSDFNYIDNETGEEIVEDVKGVKTPVYNLKKRLIEARYGIEITEWPVSKKEMAKRLKAAERKKLAAEKEERKRQRAAVAQAKRDEKARKAAERERKKSLGNTNQEVAHEILESV